MSEIEKVEPCGLCGSQPFAKQHSAFPERIDYSCDCFVLQNYWCGLHNWNHAQPRIRALIREREKAAWEAGCYHATDLFSIDDDRLNDWHLAFDDWKAGQSG